MNIFKRIVGHIYFVYAMLLFLITMVITIIPISIQNAIYKNKEAKRIRRTYLTFGIWMKVFLTLAFIRVKRKGMHHFAKGANYVVIVNHNSFADIPISSPYVPGPNKTLAKIELMKIPLFNIIYKSGSILVDRTSDESRKRSIRQMRETLDMGIHLTLYPEGTRNKSNEPIQRFYDGAFKTAINAQKDIIPGVLFHTKNVLPDRPKWWAWPHTIRFEFLAPISVQGLKTEAATRIKEEAHAIMKQYIIDNQ